MDVDKCAAFELVDDFRHIPGFHGRASEAASKPPSCVGFDRLLADITGTVNDDGPLAGVVVDAFFTVELADPKVTSALGYPRQLPPPVLASYSRLDCR